MLPKIQTTKPITKGDKYPSTGPCQEIAFCYRVSTWSDFHCLNPLLHRYSFQHINNRQLLKTLWEKKKLRNKQFLHFLQCFLLNQKVVSPFVNIYDKNEQFETSNFSFSLNVFHSENCIPICQHL